MVVKKNHFLKLQQQTIKPTTRSIESKGKVTKEASTPAVVDSKRKGGLHSTTQVPKRIYLQEPRKPEPIRPEPKKQEAVVKNVVKSPQKAGKTRGDYELNALMTRMVDDELRDLMRKTFQNLVDDAADETECRFSQILRNEVAPDLRNVIGLNITKRLLNVHNPLCVQIQFKGKPDKFELREFLKKYNFIGFARKAINIFAAQLKGIDDFDRLCTEEEVRCGSVVVSVSPEYKFTRCPTNLKTKYKDVHLEELVTNVQQDEELNRVQNKNISETFKSIKSAEKQEKSNLTNAKLETIKLEKLNEKKAEVQPPISNNVVKSNIVTKHVEAGNKPKQNIANKETTSKQESPKIIKTENKIVTSSKPETKITTPQKRTTVTVTAKVPPAKTITQVTPTKTLSQVSPIKSETKMDRTKGVVKVAPHKSTAKVTPSKAKQQICSKLATPRKSTDDEDDYDELDDYDILALMSEGIVLDECCGSDED
ncbi:unnamed protein product [Arctia plantaginis]|uniref:Uncharacterized protein n=1 Tax=Arctia plantaginis TaxID=874455 RepID=A0A8S1AQV8_ARCPL|nr:unnamed protein product [Arctia plantaginis]